VVGVVGVHLCRRASRLSDDAFTEAWGEPLDLGDDRLGRVAGVAVRHVCVAPHRVDAAHRALRIGQVLLADEHKGSFGQASGMDVALRGSEFCEGPGQMHRASPVGVRVGPGHAALDGEVDLERSGATPELAERAMDSGRQAVFQDSSDRIWREIEHRDVGRWQLRRRRDPDARFDLAAQIAEQRHHRVGDRL